VRSKAAEDAFTKGMTAFRGQKAVEALAFFEAAVTLASRNMDGDVDPRYRSFYGLSLAFQAGKFREGLTFCRKAAEEEFYNHEIWANLGRVEMEAGHTERAHAAFRRGLHLAPARQRAQYYRLLNLLGMRRKPFFSFLRRQHFLNRWMGRLTWRGPSKDG